jgi:Flp pilus assembly protein TadD
VLLVAVTLAMGACTAVQPAATPDAAALAPLSLEEGRRLTPAQALQQVETPDLLALNDDMRDFVQRYTADSNGRRQSLHSLHQAVKSPGALGIEYDPFAEGGAIEAFRRGSANCLSYASLFVALAREAGLDADYQWLEVRPQWSRLGERVAVQLHVNAVVNTGRGEQYMVDIDPPPTREITGSRRLSERQAQSLYHNNLAMAALGREQLDEAWRQLVKALALSPELGMLWVNLGAVYRQAGQWEPAEQAYLQALALEPGDRSAMTNLIVLYDLQGRTDEAARWSERVERYRKNNPFYHAWLGDQAAAEDDWRSALRHMRRALGLAPGDSNLLYTAGVIHHRLGQAEAAEDMIAEAMEQATLSRDREYYRVQLEALRRGREPAWLH